MPRFSPTKIKALISENRFYGITLDTSVIYRFDCNLENRVLCALNQFKGSSINVLISEIIASEVKNHIALKAEESQNVMNRAIREQVKRWKLKTDTESLSDKLSLSSDPKITAKQQFTKFRKTTNAFIVPAAGSRESTNKLLKRYFSGKPPFETRKQKKHEFPDAFALHSLELLGEENRQFILCVSADHGWKEFCKASESLVYVDDLSIALSYFNDSGRNTADRVMAMLKEQEAEKLQKSIEREFECQIESLDFEPQGDTSMFYESEPEGGALLEIDFSNALSPIVIDANEVDVTFSIVLDVRIRFDASFTFYFTDGIDKDEVLLGSQSFSTEDNVLATLVITTLRNTNPEPKVVDVEISIDVYEIHFGEVEPYFLNDPS